MKSVKFHLLIVVSNYEQFLHIVTLCSVSSGRRPMDPYELMDSDKHTLFKYGYFI